MILPGKIPAVKIKDLELNVIIFAKLLYKLCFLVADNSS